MVVTSKENASVVAAAKLKDKKGRREQGKFLIEGQKLVCDAKKYGVKFDKIFVTEQYAEKFADFGTVVVVSENVIKHICDAKTNQGVVAVAFLPEKTQFNGQYNQAFVVPVEGQILQGIPCADIAFWSNLSNIMAISMTSQGGIIPPALYGQNLISKEINFTLDNCRVFGGQDERAGWITRASWNNLLFIVGNYWKLFKLESYSHLEIIQTFLIQ